MTNSLSTRRLSDALGAVWLAFRRLEHDGELTSHERDVLAHIPDEHGISLHALADHLAIGLSTASGLMKRLEARGFVTRNRDPADERRLALQLTKDGRRALDQASDLEHARLTSALRSLGSEKSQRLLDLLEELAAIGQRTRPGAEDEQPHRRTVRESR